jgi:hypothetical protein
MFYSTAFSDSIRLPCRCRGDHTVPYTNEALARAELGAGLLIHWQLS